MRAVSEVREEDDGNKDAGEQDDGQEDDGNKDEGEEDDGNEDDGEEDDGDEDDGNEDANIPVVAEAVDDAEDYSEYGKVKDADEEEEDDMCFEDLKGTYGSEGGRSYGSRIYVNQSFASKDALVSELRLTAVRRKFSFRIYKSTKTLLVATCRVNGCGWKIRASVKHGTNTFWVTKYVETHICSVGDRIAQRKHCTPKEFLYAQELVRGSAEDGYERLPSYLEQISLTNPGSITGLELDSLNRFKYLFLSFGASIRGFRYQTRVIVVDGTHLNGKYQGVMLVAGAQDGNFQIFPLAFAIVDGENDESWEWFFTKLASCVSDEYPLVIVFDRRTGIKNVCDKALQDKIDILIADKATQEQLHFVGNPNKEATPVVQEVDGLEGQEELCFIKNNGSLYKKEPNFQYNNYQQRSYPNNQQSGYQPRNNQQGSYQPQQNPPPGFNTKGQQPAQQQPTTSTSTSQHQRRLNPNLKDVVKKEILKLLDAGVIYPISDSKWVSPVHVVPKKGGITVIKNDKDELIPTRTVTGHRMCIDYRKLNSASRKDHFPLPFIDQILKRLANHPFYCFLDGYSGFFQIPIHPNDQEKTTFTCPYGTFAYRRMPFDLCNAPATFQRCMMSIFSDLIEDVVEVFMDDFSVYGSSFSACLSNLCRVLQRCEDTNLVLNWEKCHFMVKEGIVLGHKISEKGIEVDKAKIDVMVCLPPPKTVKDIRSFLGHAWFYRRFIKDFSMITRPLTRLLCKEATFSSDVECLEAFKKLKGSLHSVMDHLMDATLVPSRLLLRCYKLESHC
ncbi:PREDICTED: uncharacterized protein LOC106330764 [Brassica oleracea var. oleracea]|uniref:uncharacterized protein LOC106330764 n=1 Tax=Brassica oleracea var. oleracea TaxID=109376 RepID=UPI0006A6B1CE|nr:PREDICTED: uncharacterized protein LOC106330764 [Brassica oleracea var. oleracea]